MLRYLLDEHIPRAILNGLLARDPNLDVVLVQDIGLKGMPDPDLLE